MNMRPQCSVPYHQFNPSSGRHRRTVPRPQYQRVGSSARPAWGTVLLPAVPEGENLPPPEGPGDACCCQGMGQLPSTKNK